MPPNKDLRSNRPSSAGAATVANASKVLPAKVAKMPLRLGFSKETPGKFSTVSKARDTKLPVVAVASSASGTSGSSVFCTSCSQFRMTST